MYEVVGGSEVLLASVQLSASQQMSMAPLLYTPSTSLVKLKYKFAGSGLKWYGYSVCISKPQMVSETFLVDVCDSVDDRYRFGFNGQEKDNELKGVGNSLDFGARMYDSRLGRWMSIDPLFRNYPSVSSYNFALNTPIQARDPDGNVVLFINGQHTGDGGKKDYWRSNKRQVGGGLHYTPGSLLPTLTAPDTVQKSV